LRFKFTSGGCLNYPCRTPDDGGVGREETGTRCCLVWLFNLLPVSCFVGVLWPFPHYGHIELYPSSYDRPPVWTGPACGGVEESSAACAHSLSPAGCPLGRARTARPWIALAGCWRGFSRRTLKIFWGQPRRVQVPPSAPFAQVRKLDQLLKNLSIRPVPIQTGRTNVVCRGKDAKIKWCVLRA
jgi:hypothetical protein